MKPNRNPLRKVVNRDRALRSHSSIFANFKSHYWDLELECGHTVERSIRYLPVPPGEHVPRGWSALHHPPPLTRIPDLAPARARCEHCGRAERQGSGVA